MTIKSNKTEISPYVLMDGVALVRRRDRSHVWEEILTPLNRIANAIHDEDQYD